MENSWDKEWGTSGGIPHYAGDPGSGMRSNRCITVLRIPFVSRNIFRVSISQQIWHESRINSTNNKKNLFVCTQNFTVAHIYKRFKFLRTCDDLIAGFNYRATLCVSAVFAVDRCLSVCPSVIYVRMYCMQMAEDIVKFLSRPGRPSFKFFLTASAVSDSCADLATTQGMSG